MCRMRDTWGSLWQEDDHTGHCVRWTRERRWEQTDHLIGYSKSRVTEMATAWWRTRWHRRGSMSRIFRLDWVQPWPTYPSSGRTFPKIPLAAQMRWHPGSQNPACSLLCLTHVCNVHMRAAIPSILLAMASTFTDTETPKFNFNWTENVHNAWSLIQEHNGVFKRRSCVCINKWCSRPVTHSCGETQWQVRKASYYSWKEVRLETKTRTKTADNTKGTAARWEQHPKAGLRTKPGKTMQLKKKYLKTTRRADFKYSQYKK